MKVQLRSLAEIKPYEKNPRINDVAVDAVAESIRRFGFRQPIVVDADGIIVCGHTRWKAARKLKLKTVPVHVAKDLTPEKIRALRIADNKTADLAEWDYDLLPIEMGELTEAEIDWGALGFDPDELVKLLAPAEVAAITEEETPTQSDAAPAMDSTYIVVVNCPDELTQEAVYALVGQKHPDCRLRLNTMD